MPEVRAVGLAAGLRVLRPAPNILAFYDGRGGWQPTYDDPPTWQDLGLILGTCSYAIVSDGEALVYDTHVSLDHARAIRRAVEAEGAQRIRVVLSHHHTDHIAGNAAFADCPILANAATARALEEGRAALEHGHPPVHPVVMPNEIFAEDLDLIVGRIPVALRSFNIHSHDGLVLWVPVSQTLLAGDTLEDPVTYVCEPEALETHLSALQRLTELPIHRILPNHGDPDQIAAGGYPPSLIGATERYIRALLACRSDPARADRDLRRVLDKDLAAGAVIYDPAYDAVHRYNIAAVLAHPAHSDQKDDAHAP
ncbi:MAG: MBL fold metallo-hydrolase [Pseudomonadota bacterium]